MIKVAIVGSQGKYWTPEQRTKVIKRIQEIFFKHGEEIFIKNKVYGIPYSEVYKLVTLVSGGCGCDGEKILFDGGVDMWSEIVADILGVPKDIKYAKAMQWEDVIVPVGITEGPAGLETRKGFKTRNIEIATKCDVLYCIDPANRTWSGGRWTYNYAKELGKEVYLELIT